MPNPSAALLIIGNEVLSGRTREGNLQALAKLLAPAGIELHESRVVRDERTAIIAAVNALRPLYTYVFTSGGLGPTPDDISAEAVAAAFNRELHEDPAARALLQAHYGKAELTPARLKMAQVPEGAELIENPVSKAPGFWIENVLVMAGVPAIFSAMVQSALPHLAGGDPVVSATVVVPQPESELAGYMHQIEAEFSGLTLGSYPYFRQGAVGASLVVRSTRVADVKAAVARLQALLDSDARPWEYQGMLVPKALR